MSPEMIGCFMIAAMRLRFSPAGPMHNTLRLLLFWPSALVISRTRMPHKCAASLIVTLPGFISM